MQGWDQLSLLDKGTWPPPGRLQPSPTRSPLAGFMVLGKWPETQRSLPGPLRGVNHPSLLFPLESKSTFGAATPSCSLPQLEGPGVCTWGWPQEPWVGSRRNALESRRKDFPCPQLDSRAGRVRTRRQRRCGPCGRARCTLLRDRVIKWTSGGFYNCN